nr:hypothetical protein [Campylobacter sp.]
FWVISSALKHTQHKRISTKNAFFFISTQIYQKSDLILTAFVFSVHKFGISWLNLINLGLNLV